MRRLALLCLPLFALPVAFAADKGFDKAVSRVTATFEPAEAKPGQTVTLKLTVELTDGYHTYPLVQTDKKAAAMVNKLTFPAAGTVVFVGEASDPANAELKAEPLLGIEAMKICTGVVVYERKAVVSPSAKAGKVTVKLPKFVVSVCDKDNCFPPKTLMPEAELKVLDGPAVAVDAKYAAEVKAATEKK
jgi:hypothetical protein